jgi:hypothetical protein
LTDTTGFISPQSCGVTTNPLDDDDDEEVDEADEVDDEDEEVDEADEVDDEEHPTRRPAASNPAAATVNLA